MCFFVIFHQKFIAKYMSHSFQLRNTINGKKKDESSTNTLTCAKREGSEFVRERD